MFIFEILILHSVSLPVILFFQGLELNQTCEPLNKHYWMLMKYKHRGRLKMATNNFICFH